MVTTTHGDPDPDEGQSREDRWLRYALGGDERAAVRRIILWGTLLGSLSLVAVTASGVNPIALVVAFVATALLYGTDQLA